MVYSLEPLWITGDGGLQLERLGVVEVLGKPLRDVDACRERDVERVGDPFENLGLHALLPNKLYEANFCILSQIKRKENISQQDLQESASHAGPCAKHGFLLWQDWS
jgi:hypothetical protein